jgi:hypothetical protein
MSAGEQAMADPKNVFLTDLKGFANPVIARKLLDAGARLIACDPTISADGREVPVSIGLSEDDLGERD